MRIKVSFWHSVLCTLDRWQSNSIKEQGIYCFGIIIQKPSQVFTCLWSFFESFLPYLQFYNSISLFFQSTFYDVDMTSFLVFKWSQEEGLLFYVCLIPESLLKYTQYYSIMWMRIWWGRAHLDCSFHYLPFLTLQWEIRLGIIFFYYPDTKYLGRNNYDVPSHITHVKQKTDLSNSLKYRRHLQLVSTSNFGVSEKKMCLRRPYVRVQHRYEGKDVLNNWIYDLS